MPTLVHEFDWPDRVVVGTVGRPGSRTFYLQARTGNRTASVALEKEQSALLAEKVDALLGELVSAGAGISVPTETPAELVDDDPLDQPVEEQFRTGLIRLGWDPTTSQVIIEAYPYAPDDQDDPDPDDVLADPESAEPSEMLLVRMPVGTARAFIERTRRVVGAGRPACPMCGRPVDEDGHVCAPPDEL
ncbi:DUF3090 family protein [uncultured Cellulomonas sp.]|uniref:DUF3090 family protein n=1 Tax=uncultured Cellulomonas sp. TaxID=189682 RepID=UPI0026344381|nr:DUF3090 family protein [uncultured Cellulomonas sp.]